MKKLTMLAALVAALVAFTPVANAQVSGVYVGADLTHSDYDPDVAGDETITSGGFHAGVKVHPQVAVEAGVLIGLDEDTTGTDLDVTTYSLDVIGSVPLVAGVDALALVGVNYNEVDLLLTPDETAWGYQAGVGAQVAVTDHIDIRGLVKYKDVDFDSVGIDSSVDYTVGLNYNF